MIAEKFAEVAIDFAAISDGRNNHSHKWKTSGMSSEIILSEYSYSQTKLGKCGFIPTFDCI